MSERQMTDTERLYERVFKAEHQRNQFEVAWESAKKDVSIWRENYEALTASRAKSLKMRTRFVVAGCYLATLILAYAMWATRTGVCS